MTRNEGTGREDIVATQRQLLLLQSHLRCQTLNNLTVESFGFQSHIWIVRRLNRFYPKHAIGHEAEGSSLAVLELVPLTFHVDMRSGDNAQSFNLHFNTPSSGLDTPTPTQAHQASEKGTVQQRSTWSRLRAVACAGQDYLW